MPHLLWSYLFDREMHKDMKTMLNEMKDVHNTQKQLLEMVADAKEELKNERYLKKYRGATLETYRAVQRNG